MVDAQGCFHVIELSPTTLLGTTLAGKKVMTSSGKVARNTRRSRRELTHEAGERDVGWPPIAWLDGIMIHGNKSACTCHLIPRAPLVQPGVRRVSRQV